MGRFRRLKIENSSYCTARVCFTLLKWRAVFLILHLVLLKKKSFKKMPLLIFAPPTVEIKWKSNDNPLENALARFNTFIGEFLYYIENRKYIKEMVSNG